MGVALVCLWSLTIAVTAGDDGPHKAAKGTYEVELDNAFGLTAGSDVKLGGVRAGIIDSLELDQRTRRAMVGIKLTVPGFDSLRRDAFCQARPQSLIGEYFLDCQPGLGKPLPAGGKIPVDQTGSAIGFDLLNVALRRPNNERLRLLLGELGAGVAARGPQLNAALRRALPALRETNKVLRILAEENHTLSNLVRNGDRALSGVARRRADVARFVKMAGRTSAISARGRPALWEQGRRYPGSPDELTPAMRDLGTAADAQAGALHELRAGSTRLRAFFNRLGAFSQASRPGVTALGDTAQTGRRAARIAKPALAELENVARNSPELAKNAAIVGEHLDDRDAAVEPDKRSPGGKGFTGLEALLRYVYTQAQAVNIFNGNNYMLKIGLLNADKCGNYADDQVTKQIPQCRSWLGPNQLGVTYSEPGTPPATPSRARHRRHRARHHRAAAERPAAQAPSAPSDKPATGTHGPDKPNVQLPKLPDLPALPQLPPPPVGLPDPGARAEGVLDYLLGP